MSKPWGGVRRWWRQRAHLEDAARAHRCSWVDVKRLPLRRSSDPERRLSADGERKERQRPELASRHREPKVRLVHLLEGSAI